MDQERKIRDFIKLWCSVYNDDEQALQWYCKNVLNDGKNIVSIYENDICMATLAMPSAKFNYEGEEVMVRYITNLAINPEYRDNSYELDLLFLAGNHCYSNGVDLLCGVPISRQLKILFQRRWHVTGWESSICVRAVRGALNSNFNGIEIERTTRNIAMEYNAFIKNKYCNYIVHPVSAFDYMAMEGEFYLAKDTLGNIRGIAIRLNYSKENVIDELVTDCQEAKDALIEAICNNYNWDYIDYTTYDNTSSNGDGFLRIINVKKMLSLFAKMHPNFKDSFNIVDSGAVMNTGSYLIENGECCMIEDDDTLRTVSFDELHKLIFKEYYINLRAIY